jgi:uncharacterized membrane protein
MNPNIYFISLKNDLIKIFFNFIILFIIFYLILSIFFKYSINKKIYNKEKTKIYFFIIFGIILLLFRYKFFYINIIIFLIHFSSLAYLIWVASIDKVRIENYKVNINNLKFILIFTILIIFLLDFIRIKSYHNAFHTNACDLGIFMNTLFQISNKQPLDTWIEGPNSFRFGIHFDWFLYILAVLYKINNSPEFFLFLQSLAVFWAAYVLYLISKIIIKNELFSILIAISYLISPLTASSVDFDFHLDPFYPLFVFLFVYFNLKNNFLGSLTFFVLSLSLKEEISIYLFFLSIFLYIFNKEKYNFYLVFFALIYAITVINFIMPSISPFGTHAETHINRISKEFLIQIKDIDKLTNFFLFFLGGSLFLPFLSFRVFLLILFPSAFIHYFHPRMYDIQYSALVLPGLYLSIIFVLNGKKFENKNISLLGIIILIITFGINFYKTPNFNLYENILLIVLILSIPFLVKNYTYLVLYISFITILVFYTGYFNYNKYRAFTSIERRETIKEVINFLPKNSNMPVFANLNIVPHIANRNYVDSIEYEENERVALISLIKNKCKILYIINDLNEDNILGKNNLIVGDKTKKIINILEKLGFDNKLVFEKNKVYLYKLEKIK